MVVNNANFLSEYDDKVSEIDEPRLEGESLVLRNCEGGYCEMCPTVIWLECMTRIENKECNNQGN